MACTPKPTETRFATSFITAESLSTSFITATQTIAAETTTLTITTCAVTPTGTNTTCADPLTTTSVSTIPEAFSTLTSSVIKTIAVTSTQTSATLTLFSACPTPDPNTPVVPITTTPPPITTTSTSQTTLPNGVVTTVVATITSTPPATTLYVSPPGLNNPGGPSVGHSPANLGAIIGGSLGGFFGLLAVVAAFFCYRRSKRWDDIFEKDLGHGIGDDDDREVTQVNVLPAPYHYGLVGHTISPSLSPPTSPRPHLTPQDSGQFSHHSRLSSSAATSVRSRESTAPLTDSNPRDRLSSLVVDSPGGSNWQQERRPSLGNDVPLLSRPLTAPAAGDRRLSTPTSPRFPPSAFYITNGDGTQSSTALQQRRPASAGSGSSPSSSKPTHRRRTSSNQQPVIVHQDGGRLSGDMISPVSPQADEPPAYTKR